MSDRLGEHLAQIENILGGSSVVPSGTVDPLDWHLTNIESILESGSSTGFEVIIVQELPETGENGCIYLVPNSGSETDNTYDEYIWIESSSEFEKIGTTKITTNYAFPDNWPTTNQTTTKQFCDVVNADITAIQGMSYLGEVRWSDLPSTLVNAEVLVEVMHGSGTSGKVIHLSLSSGNLAPYKWEYTYWNNGSNISGWIGFQPEITSTSKLNSNLISGLSTVATSGSYNDLSNKPTIPAAQINSDWNANSGVAEILNKPTIPTVNNATLTISQNGVSKGTFTSNASSDVSIDLTDTTYSAATTQAAGLMPALGSASVSTQTQSTKFLREDGTWVAPSYTAAGMSNPMNAQGDIIYGGNSGTPTALNKGTAGQLLASTATNPIWTNSLPVITTAPSAANTNGIIICILSTEPPTKYDGYLYLITGA